MAVFEMDPEFERRLCSSAEMELVLVERAEAVKARAGELYPDDPATTGLDLHTNITVDVGAGALGTIARVNANDWKADWYEFGTSRVAGVHALSRALEEFVGPLQPGTADD